MIKEIPNVKLSGFEGPLDLLLYLIRQQEIDIHHIPISEITHQYLATLDTMRSLNLEVAGEFILMVAYLLYIKAQMLLPRREMEAEEDPRTPLVQKLLEYQKFKQIGEELKRIESERIRQYPRSFDPSIFGLYDEVKVDYSAFNLYQAYVKVVSESPEAPPVVIPGSVIDLEEKIAYIRDAIARTGEMTFLQLTEGVNRIHLVATFIALLELAKRGFLKIKQARPFGNITVSNHGNIQA